MLEFSNFVDSGLKTSVLWVSTPYLFIGCHLFSSWFISYHSGGVPTHPPRTISVHVDIFYFAAYWQTHDLPMRSLSVGKWRRTWVIFLALPASCNRIYTEHSKCRHPVLVSARLARDRRPTPCSCSDPPLENARVRCRHHCHNNPCLYPSRWQKLYFRTSPFASFPFTRPIYLSVAFTGCRTDALVHIQPWGYICEFL